VSDNNLDQNERSPKESNEIENIERNVNDAAREVLPLQDGYNDTPRAFKPWEYTSDLPRDSNNIEMESHAWQYRSKINKFPTNSKIVKIFNLRGFLAISKYGEVYANGSLDSPESMYCINSLISNWFNGPFPN
jgi:hypothetical protein